MIFAPTVEVVYPDGLDAVVTHNAGPIGETYRGASRPGHFDGVLTVVARLFECVTPDVAVFGCKDAQQLFLVQQMVRDEQMPVRIVEVDTVRDSGVSHCRAEMLCSMKNLLVRRLPYPKRWRPPAKRIILMDARSRAREVLEGAPGLDVDYVDVVDPSTFTPVDEGHTPREVRLIVAVTVGGVRLIDNRLIHFGQ